MKPRSSIAFVVFMLQATWSAAWLGPHSKISPKSSLKAQTTKADNILHDTTSSKEILRRRQLFKNIAQISVATSMVLFPGSAIAAEQRCDVSDPRCKQDGKLGDSRGKPIPRVTNKITYVVQLIVDIGERREEAGIIRFGLYGDDCPGNVRQILQFLTRGISSLSKEALENSIGTKTTPVTLLEGGAVPHVCYGKAVDFGVPSQAKAYAQRTGVRSAGDDFLPQSRPQPPGLNEPFPRKHDAAGLVSVPAKGIGYGGGAESDDEAFASAFLITADEAPYLDDKFNRRVVGQVIDDESMAFLARLASLPTQKGVKGVIPGQISGPPLLKVTIRDIGVQKVPK